MHPLDTHWQCASSDRFDDASPLVTLSAFSSDPQQVRFLQRVFDLEVTDACVGYVLHAAQLPAGSQLSINGQVIALDSAAPHRIDVTMYVALEDNELRIQVPPGAAGSISGLVLEAVPCQ